MRVFFHEFDERTLLFFTIFSDVKVNFKQKSQVKKFNDTIQRRNGRVGKGMRGDPNNPSWHS